MGGFGEFTAHIFEAGSVTRRGQSADERMLRYGGSYYPENVGVEMVVLDLEDFRQDAKLAEPRLAVELEELVINLDCALQTKSSENGRRIFDMAKQTMIDQQLNRGILRTEGNPEPVDNLNYTKDKKYDQNKNYR